MPTLPPLATVDEIAAYGYTASEQMIQRASVRIRRHTGQQITPGTSTAEMPTGTSLLPQRPVQTVEAVVDAAGMTVPATRWQLRGQHLHVDAPRPLQVTFRHGFDPLPDELVELVGKIAQRLGNVAPGMDAGAQTEQAGGESVTWGTDAYNALSGLSSAERAALEAIYPRRPRTAVLIGGGGR